MNISTMEEEHPDIYTNGPTDEMYERWDREWGHRAPAWNGVWPGKEECREYGFWHIEGQRVPAGTPDAREDLNRLYSGECVWDVDKQKMVLRSLVRGSVEQTVVLALTPERELVNALGKRIGYGRTMQLCEELWREAVTPQGLEGSELSTGPCVLFLVPCGCRENGLHPGICDWCCGAGRVTERVRRAQREAPIERI